MIWWYEFRPEQLALARIQGAWQSIEGQIPDETLGDDYLQVTESETWRVYPHPERSRVDRSRIELRQAENFFVVRRSFGFDYGTTRETEYILCIKGDELYELRGLARLERVLELKMNKLRRIDSLPTDVRQAISESIARSNSRKNQSQAARPDASKP